METRSGNCPMSACLSLLFALPTTPCRTIQLNGVYDDTLSLSLYFYLQLCVSISNITPRKPRKPRNAAIGRYFRSKGPISGVYVTLFLFLSLFSSSSASFFGYYFVIMAMFPVCKTPTGRAYWSSISFSLSNFCVT